MTPIYGPGWGNYAIAGIVEAATPDPIALIPSTPGWWILGLGLAIGCARHLLRRWQRYRANRYRRAALDALQTLEHRVHNGDRQALRDLAPLLRATAMEACNDRSAVAGLRGEAWQAFLDDLAPDVRLPAGDIEFLAYSPDHALPVALPADLFTQIARWLREHELRHA